MSTGTSLVVDAKTLKVRQQGPATAAIWLETESSSFPQVGWSDFVVVLLVWWAGAILNVLHNEGMQVRVFFMEGPYAVDLSRSAGMLEFRMIDRDHHVGTGQAAMEPFVVGLISESRKVLNACMSQRSWSSDADALQSLVTELEQQGLQL